MEINNTDASVPFSVPATPPVMDGLLRWCDLSSASKALMIQTWLVGPIRSLAEFCRNNGLEYSSILLEFNKRGLLAAKKQISSFDDKNKKVITDALESTNNVCVNYDDIVVMVLGLLKRQLLSSDLNTDALMKLSRQLSTDRSKYGQHHAVAGIQSSGDSGGEDNLGGKVDLGILSPEYRAIIAKRYSQVGKKLVENKENEK